MSATNDLLSARFTEDFSFLLNVSLKGLLLLAVAVLALYSIALLLRRFVAGGGVGGSIEVDEVELGVGKNKIKFKPNEVDRQVAYKLWVELSTRKIGLPIDFEHDVIFEIYDSWFNFFTVTRELIKDIPVSKMQRADTRKIVGLSIAILNEGLRPHLTTWHARFRRWYEKAADAEDYVVAPQEIQTKYPRYDELTKDMAEVNERLMKYRETMRKIVHGGI